MVEKLIAGLVFPESPRWHGGRLWVSDWGAQKIVAVDGNGRSEVALEVDFPSMPMCFDWLGDEILVISSRQQRVLRWSGDSLRPYADLSEIARGFNEIVVDGRGNAYVNGGDSDLMAGDAYQPGIVALVRPDGSALRVADDIAFPNGMAVTPDNSTLIVAESYAKRLTAFDIAADGTLSGRRVWADLGDGVPDGICIDATGAVWCADVPNKRCSRVREGGEVLQVVDFDRGCFACVLGEDTLFAVTNEWRGVADATGGAPAGEVVALPAPARGAGWP